MAINTRYDTPITSSYDTFVPFPKGLSAQKYIQEFRELLERGTDPLEEGDKSSVFEDLFRYYCNGHLDGDLDLLFPVIEMLAASNAFVDSWGFTCQVGKQHLYYHDAVLKHYKKLKEENHYQHEIAWNIFEIMVESDRDHTFSAENLAMPFPTFRSAEQFLEAFRFQLKSGIDPLKVVNHTESLSGMIFLHYFNQDFDEHLDVLFSLIETLTEKKPFLRSRTLCFQGIAMIRYKQLIGERQKKSEFALKILEKVVENLSPDFDPREGESLSFSPFICVEEFADKCEELLGETNVHSHRWLCQQFSLVDLLFSHYYRGDFDDHLDVLHQLIRQFPQKNGLWTHLIGTLEVADSDADMSYQRVALLQYRKLKADNHPNIKSAYEILNTVTCGIDIDDCLEISFFEKLTALIRETRPDPNDENKKVNPICLMDYVFSALAYGELDDCMEVFPDLVQALLECGGNPNFRFRNIEIAGRGKYINPTCLHVTYLYWKLMVSSGQKHEARFVKQAFFHLLEDPRVDVKAQFSEVNLDFAFRHFPGDRNGGHLEEGTLAHYALIDGDSKTFEKIVSIARDLISLRCHIVSPTKNYRVDGKFQSNYSVIHREISLYHIAMRRLDSRACTFLNTIDGASHIDKNELLKFAKLYEKDELQKSELQKSERRSRRVHYEKLPEKKLTKRFNQVCKALNSARPLQMNPHLLYSTPLIEREGHTLVFDGRTKIPLWVYEDLTHDSVQGVVKRKNGFGLDPAIFKQIQPRSSDYAHSGFDKGHCAPADTHKCSEQEMKETFYYSNICPQDPDFNQVYWKSFEKHVKGLTKQYDHVRVITGPLFLSYERNHKRYVTYEVIGTNEVAVPTHFFKVISLEKNRIERKEAYVMPNRAIHNDPPFSNFACKLELLEKISGIVFQHR